MRGLREPQPFNYSQFDDLPCRSLPHGKDFQGSRPCLRHPLFFNGTQLFSEKKQKTGYSLKCGNSPEVLQQLFGHKPKLAQCLFFDLPDPLPCEHEAISNFF
jgi:hypothetical protein